MPSQKASNWQKLQKKLKGKSLEGNQGENKDQKKEINKSKKNNKSGIIFKKDNQIKREHEKDKKPIKEYMRESPPPKVVKTTPDNAVSKTAKQPFIVKVVKAKNPPLNKSDKPESKVKDEITKPKVAMITKESSKSDQEKQIKVEKIKTIVKTNSMEAYINAKPFVPKSQVIIQAQVCKDKKKKIVKPEEPKFGVIQNVPKDLTELLMFRKSPNDPSVKKLGQHIALDCEMVGVGPGSKDSALARVTAVNYFGHIIYDTYVSVEQEVGDYRTWVSGILPEHLVGAPSFEKVQAEVAELLKGRILVGHGLINDLKVLKLSHPPHMIRDTVNYIPYRDLSETSAPKLKFLTEKVLNFKIQDGEHDPAEDSKAAMALYRQVQFYWDNEVKAKFRSYIR